LSTAVVDVELSQGKDFASTKSGVATEQDDGENRPSWATSAWSDGIR
jgi:hypothetical protein